MFTIVAHHDLAGADCGMSPEAVIVELVAWCIVSTTMVRAVNARPCTLCAAAQRQSARLPDILAFCLCPVSCSAV